MQQQQPLQQHTTSRHMIGSSITMQQQLRQHDSNKQCIMVYAWSYATCSKETQTICYIQLMIPWKDC
jgi:hypothetical protein